MSGCETLGSSRVLPPLATYSTEFQNQMADEIEAASAACPPLDLIPGCVAWKRAVIDYGDLRRGVRALGGE